MDGTIFNIQKFCVNDGPGIRTTVFVKGCPLNCLWCHNPESKSTNTEIFYNPKKCISCRKCAMLCENACHGFSENGHAYSRESCLACGKCSEECYSGALEKVGYKISVEDALKAVLKDKTFYEKSGGGITVSGGEPMAQFEFTYALLEASKKAGLHTCMETCGFAPSERYEKIAPLVDIFLFDYKISDSSEHNKYTGVPNEKIHENLRMLDSLGAKTILRCPIIPTVNDNEAHFNGIADMANSLKNIIGIDIEPYHPLGESKTEMLGKEYPLSSLTFPEKATVDAWIEYIQKNTAVKVKKA
ncbi:MAG: glycyl-radical enzyme activating protein [Ruminococcaceae bacterium]|nr:glycyl-radical enzyme activating protein [Oscillospiraceae bacterium]